MSRTVLDTALMLDAMAEPDARDPLSAARFQPRFAEAVQEASLDLRGIRIGWLARLGNDAVAADVLEGCNAALKALSDLGADVREHTAPFENPEPIWFVNNGAYRMAQFGHHLREHRSISCPTFVRQMDRVANYSAAELYEAIFPRTRLYREIQSWFQDCSFLATPTLSRSAVPIDQDFFGAITIDDRQVENIRAAWYPYTMPFNLTENPAISLPQCYASPPHSSAWSRGQAGIRWRRELRKSLLPKLCLIPPGDRKVLIGPPIVLR